jgi:hypothetical protein
VRVFRRISKVISGIGGFLMLAFAFLRWETDIAGIPGSLSEQLAFVRALPGGTVPVIVYTVVGVALVLLAIGPYRVQAWIKWASSDRSIPTSVPPAPEAEPTATAYLGAVGETRRYPLQVEGEANEEFLRRRIEKWRAEIHESSFNRMAHGASEFVRTDTYAEMSPWLPSKLRDRFEGDWVQQATITLRTPPHERGAEGDRRVLLREAARIEKEWALNAPERTTKQATSGELKRRCTELADELSAFLDRWENYRHQEKVLPEEPWAWPRYTMERYRETLEPRLVNLLDDLEQSKWITAETRTHLPLPTDDPQKIREIAARLRGICCRY